MISINLIWILLFIVYILSFFLLMGVSYLFRKKEEPFSFLNCLPFEYFSNRNLDAFLYIFAFVSFCPLFLIIPTFGEMGDLALFNLFITFLFGLAGLSIAFISKISTIYLKTHFKLATALFCFAFLLSALVSIHFFINYNVYLHTSSNGMLYLVLGVFSSLLCVGMLVLLFNPKLKDWYKLESKTVDGNTIYSRPKFVSLAYSEWLSILVIFLSEILFFISLLKI